MSNKMINSTIKRKTCKHVECVKFPGMGMAGYCWSHLPEDVKEKIGNKRKVATKNKNKRLLDVRKLRIVQNKVNAGNELELWFKVKMEYSTPKCDNCGAENNKLPEWEKGWRSCQAHLLPKRHFKSVQTHPLNGKVLGSGFSGLCHCHDDYDSSWEKASSMRIWDDVIDRFKTMYPFIAISERRFIPEILLKEL